MYVATVAKQVSGEPDMRSVQLHMCWRQNCVTAVVRPCTQRASGCVDVRTVAQTRCATASRALSPSQTCDGGGVPPSTQDPEPPSAGSVTLNACPSAHCCWASDASGEGWPGTGRLPHRPSETATRASSTWMESTGSSHTRVRAPLKRTKVQRPPRLVSGVLASPGRYTLKSASG